MAASADDNWKDGLVAPVKDERFKTEVCIVEMGLIWVLFGLHYKRSTLGFGVRVWPVWACLGLFGPVCVHLGLLDVGIWEVLLCVL